MTDAVKIYHNPRCSKSRDTLSLLKSNGVEPEVVLYLETPPDAQTIRQLLHMLGMGSARELMRQKEDLYKSLNRTTRVSLKLSSCRRWLTIRSSLNAQLWWQTARRASGVRRKMCSTFFKPRAAALPERPAAYFPQLFLRFTPVVKLAQGHQ